MKVLFVARHSSGDNDPEGAVAHALRQLGHHVSCVHESAARRGMGAGYDFCLCFKWYDADTMRSLRCPLVFWYFDLVDGGSDPWLLERSHRRIRWMEEVTPLCLTGFCTDGDWVSRWNRGGRPQVHWLMQGMDERVAGFGDAAKSPLGSRSIVFTGGDREGGLHHGARRQEWTDWMRATYGQKFSVVGAAGRGRFVQWSLANVLAAVEVAVAPPAPVSDRYWSNRVYLTLGLGGFLLHPECSGLHEHFDAGQELVFYSSREHLQELIAHYLAAPAERQRIALRGYDRVVREHLYRHRCEVLVSEVQRCL